MNFPIIFQFFSQELNKFKNYAPGVLSKTHETLYMKSLLRRTKLDIKQINMLAHSRDFALSNKCSEVILRCLDLGIFNRIFHVLFN